LWVVIGAAAFVVVALAVLTPTVIAGGDHHGVRVMRVSAPVPGPVPAPPPLPFGRGLLPDLRQCFQRHGFGGPGRTLPTPDQLRGALRDCGPRFRR
jgi:hypothetical protein